MALSGHCILSGMLLGVLQNIYKNGGKNGGTVFGCILVMYTVFGYWGVQFRRNSIRVLGVRYYFRVVRNWGFF